ncbi:MAG: tRNA pseudouridine(38-40) synthase TruA [Clostridia bacterium]|nr:tRNA pseudouridine(38-40) synthase TruA [Clostridia bacterium]
MKYLIRLSYLGTGFSGFQVQKGSNARTVQQVLCDASFQLFGCDCLVSGCSRTDSGVHALDYAATIQTNSLTEIPADKLPYALNSKLPDDIVVHFAKIVSDDYSIRKQVEGKEYEYVILNTKFPSALSFDRTLHYGARKLNENLMNQAAQNMVGKHDFMAFMASGSQVEDTVRTIEYCKVTRVGDKIKINVRADGFLYNMVRIIVGTLIEVSEGKISPDEVLDIINSKDRSKAGRTVPPNGLYLKEVILK